MTPTSARGRAKSRRNAKSPSPGVKLPIPRLESIRATTEHLKESKQALSAEVLTQVGAWTPSTLLALGARLAVTALPFNLIVTNVPGPQLPLYMLGARMIDNFGFIPLVDSLCLGIVLFSYAGKLCWGFTGERDLLPDIHDFVEDIEVSFRELSEAPERVEIQTAPRKAARARRRTRPGQRQDVQVKPDQDVGIAAAEAVGDPECQLRWRRYPPADWGCAVRGAQAREQRRSDLRHQLRLLE